MGTKSESFLLSTEIDKPTYELRQTDRPKLMHLYHSVAENKYLWSYNGDLYGWCKKLEFMFVFLNVIQGVNINKKYDIV